MAEDIERRTASLSAHEAANAIVMLWQHRADRSPEMLRNAIAVALADAWGAGHHEGYVAAATCPKCGCVPIAGLKMSN